MVKLVSTRDLKSLGHEVRTSSSLVPGTFYHKNLVVLIIIDTFVSVSVMIDPIDHPIDLCYGINACNMKENVGYPKRRRPTTGSSPVPTKRTLRVVSLEAPTRL